MARKMKDSGIEWIGEIPEGWEVSQLKYATRWKSEKGCPDAPVLSLYRDFGVVPKDSRDDNHNVTSLDTSNYKVVDIGDLVINKMKAWQGSMAVSDYRGIVSPAYHVCSITSNKVNKRYLHHLLRNPAYLPEYARLSTGMRIGQWDLGFDDFKNIPFLIPPLDEQAKIADYLDNGCASLDAMLSKTRSSIEEYKKLKQAVITQAVTKGVRSEREMKDSGVAWIGTYPSDWKIIKIKWLLHERKDRSITGLEEPLSMSQKKGLIPTKDMDSIPNMASSFIGAKLVYKGDLVFNKLKAHLGVFSVSKYNGLVSPDYAVYHSTGPANLNFLELLFKTPQYINEFKKKSSGVGAGLTRLYTGDLYSIYCALPPLVEQEEIADYLDAKCAEIDKLIAKKEQLVKEMESYKKSLIYEVVTGKREV
jgi:type I restriction-modification system specificity subunit